jgi:DNA replication protein DnaC
MSMQAIKMMHWTREQKQRYAALPTDPQEATWECATCGCIEPRAYDVDGILHYSRVNMCPCQIAAKERQEQEQRQQQWRETEMKQTYGWLGSHWENSALSKKRFESFKADKQPEAYETARVYAQSPKGTLVLYGSFGTGKTHLLSAVCNEALAKHNVTSLFALAPDLFGAIQWRIQHNEEYASLIDQAGRVRLLVIDDIDKAKWTEFREEVYLSIIDKRVNRELPTAISTNRLDELASFVGGAVASRLQIGQIAVEMAGADYRKEM